MTARQLVLAGRRYSVDGEGYSTVGNILRVAGESDIDLEPFMMPMALANDAVIRDGACIGDPTEGALVVLAAKGGIDVEETRRGLPRVAEVPFDAEYKLMATFHEVDGRRRTVVRCFVKGAPDVMLGRVDARTRRRRHDRLRSPTLRRGCSPRTAGSPARACACSLSPAATSTPRPFDPNGDLLDLVNDLQLLALVGIVDPARKEAKDAIALCKTPASECG